ncbi:MAG: hypothetical protein ACI93N_000817 [Flavobacteriaceae bacterium]|jgi:hypothetical protein
MKKISFLLLFVFLNTYISYSSDDWGKTGHRATGEIAEKYLTKKAKKEIDKLLNGYSLAFVSTYADDIKSDDAYKKYYTWHYVNFPIGSTYESHFKNEKGDLIEGINTCIKFLKDENSSNKDKAFHLKMLVHFIGDLHQPLHIGKAGDRGGNDIKVQWFYKDTNLHAVWDSKMIDGYGMSYTELAISAQKLSKQQLESIQNGTPIDWMNDSRKLCEEVYTSAEVGENLRYRYSYEYMDTVRLQLQKGGIRLATILNDIFS